MADTTNTPDLADAIPAGWTRYDDSPPASDLVAVWAPADTRTSPCVSLWAYSDGTYRVCDDHEDSRRMSDRDRYAVHDRDEAEAVVRALLTAHSIDRDRPETTAHEHAHASHDQ